MYMKNPFISRCFFIPFSEFVPTQSNFHLIFYSRMEKNFFPCPSNSFLFHANREEAEEASRRRSSSFWVIWSVCWVKGKGISSLAWRTRSWVWSLSSFATSSATRTWNELHFLPFVLLIHWEWGKKRSFLLCWTKHSWLRWTPLTHDSAKAWMRIKEKPEEKSFLFTTHILFLFFRL